MRAPLLFLALIALVCCLSLSREARAQAIDGYTSIDYDEFSNTVEAYSETDIDYDLMGDYDAYVSLYVYDQNGSLITNGSRRAYGDSFVSISLSFTAAPDSTYTARGYHKGYANLYDYDDFYPYRLYYWDSWYYGFFEGQSIYFPWYYRFLNNGFQQVTRRSRLINLGSTHDEAFVSVGGPKPTSLSVISISVLPTGSGDNDGCRANADYGIKVAVQYQVNDQNGQPIQKSNMRPQEKILNQTFNGAPTNPADPVPNWSDIGPSRNSLTSRYTNAQGRFYDAPLGGCNDSPFTSGADQQISVLVGSRRYPVRSHHLTFSSETYGGGTISNGSDIQKSRQ